MKLKIFISTISLCIFIGVFKYFIFVVNVDYSQVKGKKIQYLDELVAWSKDSLVNEDYINDQITKRLLNTSPIWFLNFLDSMNQNGADSRVNEIKLMSLVTSQFEDKDIVVKDSWSIDYDSIQYLMEFSNLYWSASELETKYKVVFETIASYYTVKIANTLRYYGTLDPSLGASPRYYYFSQYCALKSCPVNVEIPKVMKFFIHLANQRWSHLLNATWSDASYWLKFTVVILFTLTCVSYCCLILFVVKKLKFK
jgi:hypothetical protein